MNISSSIRRLTSQKWFDTAVMVIGCLYPLLALTDIHYNFAYDWTVHLYNIAYFGEYFRQHFGFPTTINTQALVGWAIPIFYGFTFYSLTGVISSFTGAAFAYRIFVITMFFTQYYLVKKVAESFGGTRFYSHAFALLMTWTLYPLTNLYNRSASTEFAAVIAMNCGFFCWILITSNPDRWKKTAVPWLFGLFFAFSAGSHPITALYSTITFLFYWIFTFSVSTQKKYLFKVTFFSALIGALVMSPWVYVTLKFKPYLQISSIINHIWFSPQAIDWLWTRVNLFPYDPRPPYDSTPHLDAQMATSFLLFSILTLCLFWFSKKPFKIKRDKSLRNTQALALISGALFVVYFILSNRESVWALIPAQYHVVQMAYRLVSYLNLTVFLLAAALLPMAMKMKNSRPLFFLTVFCLIVSAISVGIKLRRATNVYQWQTYPGLVFREPHFLIQDIPFGNQNMARDSYVTNTLFDHKPDPSATWRLISIPVSQVTDGFGETRETDLNLPADSWILTNIQAFPWNQVLIDGLVPDPRDSQERNNLLAVKVKPGPHSFTYGFFPDPFWSILRKISYLLFFGWLVLVPSMCIWRRLKTS